MARRAAGLDLGCLLAVFGREAGAVTIAEPADGDTVQGPEVHVTLDAAGFTVTMAGDTTPNSGHHHLFLDADVSEPGVPIPAEEGRIVHMGDGSSEYTFTNVSPGEHRLITVVGDALHVPLQPWLVDTVTFTVQGGAGGR
ncbi:MAG: DUF4399 domain-containing protein [Gemmatimonadetes bacterium]|nr:DUF4399 domain-containing protein [Gemmatimonadota bacterium]